MIVAPVVPGVTRVRVAGLPGVVTAVENARTDLPGHGIKIVVPAVLTVRYDAGGGTVVYASSPTLEQEAS